MDSLTYHWDKIQPLKVMMVEKEGILVIVMAKASICSWLQVYRWQGNYPFTYLGLVLSAGIPGTGNSREFPDF